jgi:predicted ester cyclase
VLRSAFPDLRAEIVEQFANGEMVATRKTFHGTHKGEFLGVPPTGKHIAFRTVDLLRVSDGKMREHWNVVDVTSIVGQLQA